MIQIKASISILLFSFGADPLYRAISQTFKATKVSSPGWPFSFDLIKVRHSIVCFESVVPCSIRASRHDHDKLESPNRGLFFAETQNAVPAFVGYRTMRLTMSNKRPPRSRNGLVRIACLGRTHHRRASYVAPAIWMWLGPFLLIGSVSRALGTRFRGAPSPYALPVNARPMGRPQLAVTKSQHRSFGMPPWSYRPLPRLARRPAE